MYFNIRIIHWANSGSLMSDRGQLLICSHRTTIFSGLFFSSCSSLTKLSLWIGQKRCPWLTFNVSSSLFEKEKPCKKGLKYEWLHGVALKKRLKLKVPGKTFASENALRVRINQCSKCNTIAGVLRVLFWSRMKLLTLNSDGKTRFTTLERHNTMDGLVVTRAFIFIICNPTNKCKRVNQWCTPWPWK